MTSDQAGGTEPFEVSKQRKFYISTIYKGIIVILSVNLLLAQSNHSNRERHPGEIWHGRSTSYQNMYINSLDPFFTVVMELPNKKLVWGGSKSSFGI